MATYTSRLGLKKPADTDYVDVADINGNMDTLDAAFALYAVCSTAAGTAAKTVTISGFRLFTGAVAYIKFSVKNTAAKPTLNISGTGAKAIWYQGAAISSSYLNANRTYAFIYDGSVYQLIGDINTDTQYSAGTGLTKSGNTFNHANYGSAKTAGPEANDSPDYGGTIPVPQVTTNAQGHVTALTERSITLPEVPSHHGQLSIPSNANLNDYTTPGWYYCPSNATVGTLSNCPASRAFSLRVYTHAGTNQVLTTYIPSDDLRIYIRNYYNNEWSDWYRIYTQVDMPLASTTSAGFLRQLSGSTTAFLRADGTWAKPPNTTYSAFTGATATAAGKAGLVPAPAAGYNTRFLRGDGTWAAAGGMDLDALASNTDPIEIQGEGANNATGLTLRQKNASYDDMIQTLEMKSFKGPPGRTFYAALKHGDGTDWETAGTDYGGLEVWLNWTSKSGYLRPILDDVYSMGYSDNRWTTVYATNGTIQTSDRRRKSDIRLVPQKDQTAEETPALTQEDLLDFVCNVDIYTYVSDPEHTKTVQDAMAANEYEKIHIGIMANDLTGSKIFPFIGHKDGADENAPVGMKYESLGVVALYAIRALYDRIDKLEKRIEELEAERR
nr:MAG TPA: Baseplate component [Caudoviricetes sp.]